MNYALKAYCLQNKYLGAEEIDKVKCASKSCADSARSDRAVNLCLCLIYYFTMCDFLIKFMPPQIAEFLRYLPEMILYGGVIFLRDKKRNITQFPLLLPLCVSLVSMAISTLLNAASQRMMLLDFYTDFRFVSFAFVLWNASPTCNQMFGFIDKLLGLTIIQVAIGAIELTGDGAMHVFRPVLGWDNGVAYILSDKSENAGGWIYGTFSNYNHFGMFMVMSSLLAFYMYLVRHANRYLWIAFASSVSVIFSYSRHSLLALATSSVFLACGYRRELYKALGKRNILNLAAGIIIVSLLCGPLMSPLQKRILSVTDASVLDGDHSENIRLFMITALVPMFMNSYPLFGQGPFDPSEKTSLGESDTALGPTFKGAADVPGWATFYAGDVVWLMTLALYGCCGLVSTVSVYLCIIIASIRLSWNVSKEEHGELKLFSHVIAVLVGVVLLSGFFSQEIIARDTIPTFWALCGFLLAIASQADAEVLVEKADLHFQRRIFA